MTIICLSLNKDKKKNLNKEKKENSGDTWKVSEWNPTRDEASDKTGELRPSSTEHQYDEKDGTLGQHISDPFESAAFTSYRLILKN